MAAYTLMPGGENGFISIDALKESNDWSKGQGDTSRETDLSTSPLPMNGFGRNDDVSCGRGESTDIFCGHTGQRR
jgi:hypothetical protein